MKTPGSKRARELQDEFGTSSRASGFYNNQMLSYLNPSMQEYISSQSMVFVATSDSQGECDCSFRANSPGFITIFSKKSFAYPVNISRGYEKSAVYSNFF